MAYDLYLRGAVSPDAAAAAPALAGDAVRVRPFVREGGDPSRPEGLDLEIPLGLGDPAALCRAAFAIAGLLDLQVFDPQLGEVIAPGREDAVRAKWAEISAWSADTVGGPGPPPAAPSGLRLAPLALIAGAIVLGLLALRACTWLATG